LLQGAGEDALHGQIEFDLGARFEYSLKDYEKARAMYEKAIDKGHGLASFNLGMRESDFFFPSTSVKVKVHEEELADLMRTGATSNTDCTAATWYLEGKNGVKRDTAKALELMQSSAGKVTCAWCRATSEYTCKATRRISNARLNVVPFVRSGARDTYTLEF
jgi:hypothetical protein